MGAAEAVESGEQVSLLVTMFHFVPLRSRAATQKPSSSHCGSRLTERGGCCRARGVASGSCRGFDEARAKSGLNGRANLQSEVSADLKSNTPSGA